MENEIRNCLICQQSFEIKTDDIPTSIVNSKILFDSCMGVLNIEEQFYSDVYKWKWDGRFDLPNFCSTCADDIALLSVFDEDLNIIKNEIKENVAKVKTVILNSISVENRNLHAVVPDLFSSNDVSTTTKIQYYRSCAVRDWNPVVTLSRLENVNKTDEPDDGIIDLSETKEVVLLSREEGNSYILDVGDKLLCKLCLTVVKVGRPICRHVDAVHRKIRRYKCKYCNLKYSKRIDCKRHVIKLHRNVENVTPLSLAKFYSKSNYLRNVADENEVLIQKDDTPFIKPLVIKCEPMEENNICVICSKYFDESEIQLSSEVFDSVSRSLKVSQWDRWKESSNSDLPMLCASCSSLAMDLHFNKLDFEDTQVKFDKLLFKFKTKLLLSNTNTSEIENSDSLPKSISIAQKANYFRKLAVKEFTPVIQLIKIDIVDNVYRNSSKWRTPTENSIFNLVKNEEIIVLDPDLVDRILPLTEEEREYYFQYDGKQYTCRICRTTFATYYSANSHCNSKHKLIMRFQCKYCDEQFYQRNDCAHHMVTSHKMERAKIAAEIEKSIEKSRSAKMTSADGVIKIAKDTMPPLPPGGIMKVNNKYKCTICSTWYKNRNTVIVHQKKVHLKFNRYKCEFCEYKNHIRHPVVYHVRTVHSEKLRQNGIELPPARSRSRSNRKKVDLSSFPDVKVIKAKVIPNVDEQITIAEGQYLCKFCGRQFISRGQIVKHLEGVHFGIRKYQCKICHLKFYSAESSKRHIKKEHSNKEGMSASEELNNRMEDCPEVEHVEFHNNIESSEIPVSIAQPVQNVEEDSMSAYIEYPDGEETPMEIPVLEKLDIKVLPFTFDTEDSYVCEVEESRDYINDSEHSSFTAATVEVNNEEMDFGSDNKMGKDPDPIYKLIQPGNVITLPKHPNYENELKQGFKETAKGFQCLKCDKVLKRLTIFRQHWGTVHDTSGNYECSICQKRFYFKFKCAQHYICKHTNLKPYFCNICEKSFGTNTTLEKHVTLHIGERPFPCTVCPMRFISQSVLQRHLTYQHMILGT